MAQQLVQAYKQAPWRIQLQKIGLFLLALVTVVLIASIYLDITTKAANAGVQIRILETDRVNIERKISDLNTQLAILNSSEVMEKRSIELGFVPATAEDIQYIAREVKEHYKVSKAMIKEIENTINMSTI